MNVKNSFRCEEFKKIGRKCASRLVANPLRNHELDWTFHIILRLVKNIGPEPNHVLNSEYKLLLSNQRNRLP